MVVLGMGLDNFLSKFMFVGPSWAKIALHH